MNPTRNDLPLKTRQKVVELLGERLADSLDLQAQAKQAHWNVKGPQFSALHALFDAIHDEVRGYTDLIAERGVMLGGQMHGTVRVSAKKSQLPEYPLEARAGQDHVDAMSDALAVFGKAVRAAIGETGEWGDEDTADLFTEISRGIDMRLWMLEAHNQENPLAQASGQTRGRAIKAVR